MAKKLKIGVAGLGRMGAIHALHACELESEIGGCELAALADADSKRARQVSTEIGRDLPIFPSVEALAEARICDAAVIVTPTDYHQAHAMRMIAAGTRVMLEKPLTGTL